MLDPVAYEGTVNETGKFFPYSPNAFKFALRPFVGKRIKVTFEEYRDTRSNQQNRAFYGIAVKLFCEYMGYRFSSAREKEFVKNQILEAIGHYDIVKGIDGRPKNMIRPTSNMDTREFSEMYEACQELGASLGLVIPDPDSAHAMAAKV